MTDKRVRPQNFSMEDILKLINIVQGLKSIVENKKTDAVSSNEKTKAWEKIANMYNAQVMLHRKPDHLRQKYDSLKKDTRKYYAQLRQQRLQTGGGGAPTVDSKLDVIYRKIHELIKLSTEGHLSRFDSDATFLGSSENVEIDVPVVNSENTNTQICELSVPLVMAFNPTEASCHRNPVQVLRSALDSNLDVRCSRYLQTADTNSSSLESVPNETNDEAVTLGEGLPSTQASGDQSGPSRRKQTRHQRVPPLSATAKQLAPWATAKKELAELQMEMLRQQHQREEELLKLKRQRHEREEEIFKLERESLELKIKIRKETLQRIISE